MSFYSFIGSDFLLEDVENPHIKLLSINEALENGVAVSELVLNSDSIDRNKPNTVLVVDKEENLGEITIKATDKAAWSNELPISLKYCSTLEFRYTEERALKLIAYIRKHLEVSNVIEVFHIWLGNRENEPVCKKLHIHINDLLPTDFEKMLTSFNIDKYSIEVTCE